MRKKARLTLLYVAFGAGFACYLFMSGILLYLAFNEYIVLGEHIKPIIYLETAWTLVCLPVFVYMLEKGFRACVTTSRE